MEVFRISTGKIFKDTDMIIIMEKMNDFKNILVLTELRKNSRKMLSKIAHENKFPVSTIFDNYKKTSEIIKRYVSLIDFDKIGYTLRRNFIFSIKKGKSIDFVEKNKNMNSLQKIGSITDGKNSFYLECLFRNTKEAHDFKEMLIRNKATDIRIIHVIEELKKEKFLADQDRMPY